ncbi:MAG: hypothetical protein ACO1TE_17435 [Prosthecobacter sp.]
MPLCLSTTARREFMPLSADRRPAPPAGRWRSSPQGGAEFTTLTHLMEHPWNRAAQKLRWRGA